MSFFIETTHCQPEHFLTKGIYHIYLFRKFVKFLKDLYFQSKSNPAFSYGEQWLLQPNVFI